MAKKAFDKIMAGLKDAEAYLAGAREGFVTHLIPEVDVRAIRAKVGGSRETFSNRFGLDTRAVQDWEQGRRTPDRSTRVLMLIIENEPKVVERVVNKITTGLDSRSRAGAGVERISRRAASLGKKPAATKRHVSR